MIAQGGHTHTPMNVKGQQSNGTSKPGPGPLQQQAHSSSSSASSYFNQHANKQEVQGEVAPSSQTQNRETRSATDLFGWRPSARRTRGSGRRPALSRTACGSPASPGPSTTRNHTHRQRNDQSENSGCTQPSREQENAITPDIISTGSHTARRQPNRGESRQRYLFVLASWHERHALPVAAHRRERELELVELLRRNLRTTD